MYKTYPVQLEIVERDTINFLDKYGFRHGNWSEQQKDGEWLSFERKTYYSNGQIQRQYKYLGGEEFVYKFWYEDGTVMAIANFNGKSLNGNVSTLMEIQCLSSAR